MIEIDNVYNGDCLDILQQIPDNSIDTCITDMPYGIDFQSCYRNNKVPKIANDKKPFLDFIKYLPRIIKPTGAVYLFTRWDVQQCVIDELTANGMKPKNVIIWDKTRHSMGNLYQQYGFMYESIVFSPNKDFRFLNGRPKDIIRCEKVLECKLAHPNEKPIPLLQKLITDSTPQEGVVLDCTCGSGTTLLAAIREKRHYIGIELDEYYYKLTLKRIENEKKQKTLF